MYSVSSDSNISLRRCGYEAPQQDPAGRECSIGASAAGRQSGALVTEHDEQAALFTWVAWNAMR